MSVEPVTDKLPAIVTFEPLVVIATVPSLDLIEFPPSFKLPTKFTSVLAFGNVIAALPALFFIVLSPLEPNCIVLSFINTPSIVTPDVDVFSIMVSVEIILLTNVPVLGLYVSPVSVSIL